MTGTEIVVIVVAALAVVPAATAIGMQKTYERSQRDTPRPPLYWQLERITRLLEKQCEPSAQNRDEE